MFTAYLRATPLPAPTPWLAWHWWDFHVRAEWVKSHSCATPPRLLNPWKTRVRQQKEENQQGYPKRCDLPRYHKSEPCGEPSEETLTAILFTASIPFLVAHNRERDVNVSGRQCRASLGLPPSPAPHGPATTLQNRRDRSGNPGSAALRGQERGARPRAAGELLVCGPKGRNGLLEPRRCRGGDCAIGWPLRVLGRPLCLL